MKRTRLVQFASAAAVLGVAGAGLYLRRTRPDVINPAVPEPARTVSLDRYLGRWFEIARHENRFEKGLEAVTADYALLPDGKIEVINGGRKGSPQGAPRTSRGRAIVVDTVSRAKLKVSFFGPLYTGDYWVLDHDDDYRWSIVGEPSGRYLWLLAREATPAPELVVELLDRAHALGYDRTRLKLTQQV
ncbi:lipocalin family protein [Flavisphingomonas formosensis]|uniref:lipocalin family protein n=1 Tax=Flavisphingomonas formosensis TaxID=861534 RepID=UPI0012FC39CD|nr:lipocalin family protein [Sphingomonas formosensis]